MLLRGKFIERVEGRRFVKRVGKIYIIEVLGEVMVYRKRRKFVKD